MKRRYFLAGVTLSAVSAGCKKAAKKVVAASENDTQPGGDSSTGRSPSPDSKTLVVATSANYPPYEQRQKNAGSDSRSDSGDEANGIVGFDIDLVGLIAERLTRSLKIIDLPFGSLIPALVNGEAHMAIAALSPSEERQQKVDFSEIYYRSRHSLVSEQGGLRSQDLDDQTLGIHSGSAQARYAERLSAQYPNLQIATYVTIAEAFEAIANREVDGILLEATVAASYLKQYPAFQAQVIKREASSESSMPLAGCAIALPKNSPLRSDINTILSDLKGSGDIDQLIYKWFS